jgi:hypothetical protein
MSPIRGRSFRRRKPQSPIEPQRLLAFRHVRDTERYSLSSGTSQVALTAAQSRFLGLDARQSLHGVIVELFIALVQRPAAVEGQPSCWQTR